MKRFLMCVCLLTAVLHTAPALLAGPKTPVVAPVLVPGANIVLNGRTVGRIPPMTNGVANVPLSTGERLSVIVQNGQVVGVQTVDRTGRLVPSRFQVTTTFVNGQLLVVIAIIAILIGM